MASAEDIVRVYRVDRIELDAWIEQRWVKPARRGGRFEFDDVDEARIALILELRRDLMVENEAMGLILSLLDQVYAARQMLRTVEDAIDALPEPSRRQVRDQLRRAAKR